MAGSNHAESDLLRAVTHARMHVTSGRGLESVIHDLINANLGIVSQALSRVEAEMAAGRDTEQSLQYIADKIEDENLRNFLTALRTPGAAAISRLNDLADNIQANWNFSTEKYGARVSGITQVAAVLMLGTLLPTIIRVIAELQLTPGERMLELPPTFEAIVYSSLSVLLTLLIGLLRIR